MSGQSLRLRGAAAALTLLSGAVMMLAGYVGHTESWTTGGLITVPGGVVILAAFAFARAADRAGDRTPARRGNGARQAGAMAATLLSGGVMVFAGFAGAASSWALAAGLAIMGGLVIAAAFVIDRSGTETVE
jgi:hypothetical protein